MTFEEWEDVAEPVFTVEFGSKSVPAVRDVYVLSNGVSIQTEFFMPASVFKLSWEQCLVDYIVSDDIDIPGGEVDCGRYCDDGFGFPLFRGEDSVRKAWDYAMKIKIK